MSPPRFRVLFHQVLGALAATASGLAACTPSAPLHGAERPAAPVVVSEGASAPPQKVAAALDAAHERARALVREMTLEEKLAALVHVWDWSHRKTPEELCAIVPEGAGSFERIGLYRDPADTARFANALRECVTQKSRLHIPPFLMDEGVHGLMQQGATSFPVALALGATFNPALVREIFGVVALEASSRGTSWILGPNLDLAREPRWGRIDEMYGEDPYLVSRLGVAAIAGLQGDARPIAAHHVLATAKHFAAHSQPESGANGGPVNVSERILRSEFFVPFDAAVHEANVGAIMAAYNEIDGVPGHINSWLLGGVLRDEWHFGGVVISDGMGVERLQSVHHVSQSPAESARKALLAGIDYEIGRTFLQLVDEVAAQRVPLARIDEAVERTLAAKVELGLFEQSALDPGRAAETNNAEPHRALALEAARQAAVLLKNDGLLPLERSKLKRVAVVGPNAALAHLGGYSVDPGRGVSLLDGVRAAAGKNIEVRYARGCNITRGDDLTWQGFWQGGKVELPDPATERELIAQAVQSVKGSDVAIVAVGENELTSREAWDNHLGDRDSLQLLGMQDELVAALAATGVPLVLVVINGRPLEIGAAVARSRAAVEAFYLGQEGGTALGEILFGDVAPSGHLPITLPKSVGQLPVYYYRKPSARGDYLFSEAKPLFPFGWGLTYTTFSHSDVRVEPAKIGPNERANVSVTVTNTGGRAGTDVVQLYVGARSSSVTRPVRLARGFERVTLAAGESRPVSFELGPDDLALWNLDMQREVEPGSYVLEVGSNSAELASVTLDVTAP
ncbi:MAG TPA: glycoside hydrolase family 3 N-terminal domain-containing protein [Polyangiaceae bacterium]|nr:glycoside hydrolase family 3 N-terminal domain-containing protein [Polyangiaceae bacterium]